MILVQRLMIYTSSEQFVTGVVGSGKRESTDSRIWDRRRPCKTIVALSHRIRLRDPMRHDRVSRVQQTPDSVHTIGASTDPDVNQ